MITQHRPKISIITSTYNCKQSLTKTANSIREQSYTNIEWIIVDGASEDGTVDIIRENVDITAYWISERDNGIYDAWNKACKYITGDWVIFMGAGDCFCHAHSLEEMSSKLSDMTESIGIVYGNVYQKNKKNIIQFSYKNVDLNTLAMGRPTLPCHQGVFQRSSFFKSTNPFDSSYRIAADSKFLLQSLKQTNIHYIDLDICDMEMGGIGASAKSILKLMNELNKLGHENLYSLPIQNKIKFTLTCYAKYLLYSVAGEQFVEWIARIKRRIN